MSAFMGGGYFHAPFTAPLTRLSRAPGKVRTMTSRQQQELRATGEMFEGVAAIWSSRSARFPQLWSNTHETSQPFKGRIRGRLARRDHARHGRTFAGNAGGGR